MHPRSSLSALLLGIAGAAMVAALPAVAAEPDVTIRLRPHCPEAFFGTAAAGSNAPCREFTEQGIETLVLYGVKAGDTVDLDVVLTNPSLQPIQSVQSWLAYDPAVLQGQDVRVADTFPLVAPGEQTFSAERGVVRIGASNVSGGMRDPEITFARVTFQVLASVTDPVHIRFHEFSLLGQEGKTKVLLVEGGSTVNVLRTRPKDLLLSSAPAPLLPTTPGPTTPLLPPGTLPPLLPDDGFTRLQPLELRAATEDDRVYLIWVPLTDPRVIGYNVYYGAVSGRYVQRRTVASGITGVLVRGLPAGKRYYFAVTAYDASERETEFSYEVAVVVGDPGSSTAPFDPAAFRGGGEFSEGEGRDDLRGSVIGRGRVPGSTGMPLAALITLTGFAAASAFFFRRASSRSA